MKKILLALGLVVLVTFAGCKKDKGEPPTLPPVGTMMIDFTNFEYQKKGVDVPAAKGTENSSWEFAAKAAGTFKLILGTTLLVPVTSFQLAIDQSPEYVSDKKWQWVYNANIGTDTYQAKLVGEIGSAEVTWKMYITKQNAYTDFLWFEGTSALDGNSGQWTLYYSNANNVPVLQIDWKRSGDALSSVKYTYTKEDTFKGSYIEYGFKTGDLNAYYTIHYFNGTKFSEVNVEWSTTGHQGRVKSIDYLGDDQWHCWNANRVNVTCS